MVDGLLVAVTVASLCMAAIMAVITWRVIRLDRKHPPARAGIRPRETRSTEEPFRPSETPAWPPIARDPGDTRWSDVAIERTRALPLSRAAKSEQEVEPRFEAQEPPAAVGASTDSDAYDGSRGKGRFAVVVGVGAMALTAVLGGGLVFGESWPASATRSPAAAQVTTPLDLVALAAARDGDRVTIRGMVRNPAAGTRVDRLEAVFFLFDRRGMYVGTTRTAIAQGILTPGSESAFEVPLTPGLQVSQYRVCFRMSTFPVPHIDRRPTPAAIITAAR